ncbi:MAG: class I SAM-dependent methyltransferase [Acidobacteria bacterium]|nr:class I SAM-dependent methyltransferase [Acidobacteriota bacterium]
MPRPRTKPPSPTLEPLTPTRWTYAGLFTAALSTLMFEVLLTRIFSVTMFYHFAFVAISVAMFGMTAGAMAVYLLPNTFTPQRLKAHLAVATLMFALTSLGAFLLHVSLPTFSSGQTTGMSAMAPTYIVMTVPFFFSGVAICLALTRYSRDVSRLYTADLIGAAIGCVATVVLLKVTDGPTAVVAVAGIAAAGAACFAMDSGAPRVKWTTIVAAVALLGCAAGHTVLVWQQRPLLRLFWVKGKQESPPLYEKWNSFSRVTVTGRIGQRFTANGWGLSHAYPTGRSVAEIGLTIDNSAGTPLTGFTGDLGEVQHLKYDLVNIAHYLKKDADVLVVGTGGGRDVLAALAFGQKSIVGVEINENIIKAVNERFGDFTGHLDQYSNVRFVNDEARSFIARQTGQFDILQISLIDTWAATAAGAFVLSENSLYTVDAWKIFLHHVRPAGILTVTRWYFRDRPSEMYRLTGLATEALSELGVARPRDHMVILRAMKYDKSPEAPDGVGTILVSPTPFKSQDLDRLDELAATLKFEIVLSPRTAVDEVFGKMASADGLVEVVDRFPLNIAPPTDDAPFFFHMLRLKDVFDSKLRASWEAGANRIQLNAVSVLATLLAVVLWMTAIGIGVPLAMTRRRVALGRNWPLLVYFGGIGMGFMLIEISQMQRLVVFLGHPTYALSVVLFALLLSSGVGSFLTSSIGGDRLRASARALLGGLLGALALFGIVTPRVAAMFEPSSTPVRILLATGILFALGIFMGTAFPLGMKLAASTSESLTPWLWGVNGAASVLASVLAVVIALTWGISAAFWTGAGAYAIAFFAFQAAGRSETPAREGA